MLPETHAVPPGHGAWVTDRTSELLLSGSPMCHTMPLGNEYELTAGRRCRGMVAETGIAPASTATSNVARPSGHSAA